MKFEITVAVLGLLTLIAAFVAFTGIAPAFVLTMTKYAPEYSEPAFERIKVGDSESCVLKALGQPLFRYDKNEGMMMYSKDNGTIYYQRRWLRISNGVVSEKISDLYYD